MNTRALLEGLRFTDTFFPAGGYAFSSGLEAAVQHGAVGNAEQLFQYGADLLRGGMSRREAAAVKLASRAGARGVLSLAVCVDLELEAMKLSRDSRVASRQMGRQVIKIASDQFPTQAVLSDYRDSVEMGKAPGHLAVSLGLTLGACGWNGEQAAAAFLYQTAVGLVSASMRLCPIGQREGQRILGQWLPLIDRICRQVDAKTPLSSWSPLQDIYAMRHGQLEWRLFRS